MLYQPYLKNAFFYKSGRPPEDLIKKYNINKIYALASNENYLGISPNAVKAIKLLSKRSFVYPDTLAEKLKQKLSAIHNVSTENILISPGSSEIISMLYHAFVLDNEQILAPNPSFLLYNVCAKMFNKKIDFYDLDENFNYSAKTIINKITSNTKLIIITSPNNPTGTIITKNEIQKIIDSITENQILLVDEAYIEFNDAHDRYESLTSWINKKNIVLLRTFSKLYGLAGLRIGYCFASNQIMEGFLKVLKPFSITSLSEAAACASLDDHSFIDKTLAMVKKAKSYCYSEFKRLNLQYSDTHANFIFVKTPKPDQVYDSLMKKGIVVRPTKAFGYENAIRITFGNIKAMKYVIKSIEEMRHLFL